MFLQRTFKIRHPRLTKIDLNACKVQQKSRIFTKLLLGRIEIFIWKGIDLFIHKVITIVIMVITPNAVHISLLGS